MPILRHKEETGTVLRQLRQSLGLKQRQVADICGVSVNYIGQVEIGWQSMAEPAVTKLLQWIAEQGTKQIEEGPPPAALLKLRSLLGFSPFALATKLGVKETAIRCWEAGNLP